MSIFEITSVMDRPLVTIKRHGGNVLIQVYAPGADGAYIAPEEARELAQHLIELALEAES